MEGGKQGASETLGKLTGCSQHSFTLSQHKADSYSSIETNCIQAKTKGVSVAEDPGIRKKLLCTYPLNHNGKNILRQLVNHISFVMLILTGTMIWTHRPAESEPGLMELYNRLGMLQHDLNDDINSDIPDFVDIHGPTVASCPVRDSPVEGPVFAKGQLRDHPSFWYGIKTIH